MAAPRAIERRLSAGLLALGLVLAAGPGLAQSASERAGLRTLTWPGKAEAPVALRQSPRPQAVRAEAADDRSAAPAVQPSVLPDYAAVTPRFPQSLTPATAFGVPPVASGATVPASAPYADAAGVEPVRPTPIPQTPVPATAVPQTPVAAESQEAADPMAPRRDAAIWRLADGPARPGPVQPEPQADPHAAADDRDGARYYSVHRLAGRDPDPTTLPAPFFLDSAPVDLAEPPPPPTLMRHQGGLAPSVAGDNL